jgi:hypothetical protein
MKIFIAKIKMQKNGLNKKGEKIHKEHQAFQLYSSLHFSIELEIHFVLKKLNTKRGQFI